MTLFVVIGIESGEQYCKRILGIYETIDLAELRGQRVDKTGFSEIVIEVLTLNKDVNE